MTSNLAWGAARRQRAAAQRTLPCTKRVLQPVAGNISRRRTLATSWMLGRRIWPIEDVCDEVLFIRLLQSPMMGKVPQKMRTSKACAADCQCHTVIKDLRSSRKAAHSP